jgi:hypothetical protein
MSQARNLSGFLAKVLASGDLTDSGVDAIKLGGKDSSYYLDYNNLANVPATGTDSAAVSAIITSDVDAAFINALTIDADTLGGQNSAYYLNYNNLGNQPNILDSTNVSAVITADVDAAFINALTIDADTLGGNAGSYYLDYSNFTNTPTLPVLGTDFVDSVEARGLISVTDLGGDGSLAYNSSNGILTYTGPSAAEVRAHFSAGTGVTVSSGQISVGQAVGTTDNVTFNDMIVSGDLTVSGTTTTVNSNTVHIGDNIISLNHDETGTPSQDAGIEIERGTSTNKTLVWNETTDKWTVGSETFVAGMFEGSVAATTLTADSATLGAVEGFSHLKAPHSATTKTYTVTVATKTSAHRYNGTGSSNGFVIDGMEAPFLTLTPGRTYRFDQADATNSGHPFRFYYDVAKNDSYTTDITTAGTAGSSGAYTEITVTDTTPLVLHYQCSAHGNMGNAVQTNARNLTGFTTDDLGEGSSNFYYTDARVTTLVDSAYVQARQTSGGGGGVDSASTIALITSTVDSAYVALREADAGGGGGGGSALTIQDEGSSLSTAATTLNFTGSAVTASGTGATKTINITGGGGGGGVNVAASYVEDYTTTIYTATAGLTTFNSSSSPALPAYTAGKIGVFVNGVKRTDFTATDGTSVVMTNALALNDHVEIINFGGPLRSAQDVLTETKFTATAGQTTFNLNYTAGHITVFLNGAKLSADDYTATNGTSVVLTTGATLNDVVEVIEHGVAFATPYSATNYTKGVSGNVSGNIVSSLTYTPGKEAVYLNGIKLLSGDDYTTVDSGSSITFINNIVDSDRIEVVDHGIIAEATQGLDSAATINLIDSDYVTARAGASGGLEKDYRYNGILYPQNGTSRLYLSSNVTLNEVVAFIEVGPVGSDLDLRINKNGVSATTLTITDGATSATTTPTVSFISGDYITVDITSVGGTTAGANLHMVLKFS